MPSTPIKKLPLVAQLVEGFFILLPALIAYLMLGQLFDMLLSLTQPILDVMPERFAEGRFMHQLTAAAILLGLCWLVGLAARSTLARRAGRWFEATFLQRFPPYSILKSLSAWMAGREAPEHLLPATLELIPGSKSLVAIVEELPDGRLTVFVPVAPTPGVGFLQIVEPDRVERLDSSMTDAIGWLMNWGRGTDALFRRSPNDVR